MTSETAAKLPPLFRRHVRRPRLTRLIEETTAQCVVIHAPAGYGKTVLASEWAQGKDKIAWYQATPASADVAAFSVGVADVASPIVPHAGERLRQRLWVSEPPERAVRALSELLADDLQGWPRDAWLVIDDYHLLADSAPVEEFLDWLLTFAPLRLLVTSRHRPAWASARRILHGELVEIRQEELTMTNEEASGVLHGRPTETVRALVTQAHGWPAIIGLAALATSPSLPDDRISEPLFRYFADEVLRQEPSDVQEFMLVASVPATLNREVASRVLDAADPEPLLERLVLDGLLRPAGHGRLTFHPLLREFLRHRLANERPQVLTELRRRAIEAARSDLLWAEAFELAIEGGESATAAAVLGDAGAELLASGRHETVEKWLDACGVAGTEHPPSVITRTEFLIIRGQLSEAAGLVRELAEQLPEEDPNAARAWYLAGQANYLLSRYHDALECHRRARAAATTLASLKDALWGLFITSLESELEGAEAFLDELEALRPQSLDDRLRLASGRVNAGLHSKSFEGVWSRLEPLLSQVRYASNPMARSSFVSQAAYACVARSDYKKALELAEGAIQYCRHLGLVFPMGYCLVHRAGAEIGVRNFRRARSALTELIELSNALGDPYLLLESRVMDLKLSLAESGPDEALSHIRDLPEGDLPRAPNGEFRALASLAAAAAGERDLASSLRESALALTDGIEAHFFARYSALISAHNSHDPSEILQSTSELARDTAEAEFTDALVVAYRAYPPLLGDLATDSTNLTSVRRLMRSANDHRLARNAGIVLTSPQTATTDGLAKLTRREREVLELLGHGLSNREISNRLFITTSTTKVHVHHILEKLGAKTRLQAALAARRLEESDVTPQ